MKCVHKYKCVDSRNPGYINKKSFKHFDEAQNKNCLRQRKHICIKCKGEIITEEIIVKGNIDN